MNREKTKDLIRVMQAYVDGEPIKIITKNPEAWYLESDPDWSNKDYSYSIIEDEGLLSCPFCGSKGWMRLSCIDRERYQCLCTNNDCRMSRSDTCYREEKNAVGAWNTRVEKIVAKNCPFCGSKNHHLFVPIKDDGIEDNINMHFIGCDNVYCITYGSGDNYTTKEEAIEKWNRRS